MYHFVKPYVLFCSTFKLWSVPFSFVYQTLNDVGTANFSSLLYCSAASFTALDRNYLTPFFTSHNGDEDDESKFDFTFYLKLCNFH